MSNFVTDFTQTWAQEKARAQAWAQADIDAEYATYGYSLLEQKNSALAKADKTYAKAKFDADCALEQAKINCYEAKENAYKAHIETRRKVENAYSEAQALQKAESHPIK